MTRRKLSVLVEDFNAKYAIAIEEARQRRRWDRESQSAKDVEAASRMLSKCLYHLNK